MDPAAVEVVRTALAAARFASWCNAVLAGGVSLDAAAAGVADDGRSRGGRSYVDGSYVDGSYADGSYADGPIAHRLIGLPDGAESPEELTLPVALGRLRARGATYATTALPAPGDPVGLAGPRPLTELAVECGHAVLVAGVPVGEHPALALIGRPVERPLGTVMVWETHAAADAPAPVGLATASRLLREAVLAAADELSGLDVRPFDGGARAGADRAVTALHTGHVAPGPGAAVYDLASRLWVTARVALADDGGALSASTASSRRARLAHLEAAARRALAAAAGPEGVMAYAGRPGPAAHRGPLP